MKAKESNLKPTSSKASRRPSLSMKSPATRSFLVNLDDLVEPLVAIPPDGGWGWFIVLVASLIMFCIDGIGYCFALFFEDIRKDLKCSLAEVALVSSLAGGFYYLAGPLTCSAINRLGFQIIAVIGGTLACAAFLGSSYMTTVLPFLCFAGVLGGTAFNLMYTPSVIALGFYFERWRALAMAISGCGSSLGVTLFPIIVKKAFAGMHWTIMFRIIAGVFGLCGLFGLAYKPIKATKVEKNVQFGHVSQISNFTLDNETELKGGGGIAGIFQRFKNALFPTISEVSFYGSREASRHPSKTSSLGYSYYMHRQDDEALSTYMQPYSSNENVTGRSFGNISQRTAREMGKCRRCCYRCWKCSHCSPCCMTARQASVSNVNRPLYRDDIFYSGSVFVLPEYSQRFDSHVSTPTTRATPSLAYTLSVSRAPTQRDLEQHHQCVCCPEAVLRVLATMLHFQMLKSPTFILLLISGYLSLMGTYIVFTYLPSYAAQKGVDKEFSDLLFSVIGISNTFGRAVCGVVSCFPVLDVTIISCATISISGLVIVCSIMIHSATEHIIIYVLFGFNLASFAILRPLMFVDLFGLENLTNCFGINMLFQALAAFSAAPIANFIHGSTNSFTIVFIFTGTSILLSGIILIPVKCVLRWEQRRKKKVTFT